MGKLRYRTDKTPLRLIQDRPQCQQCAAMELCAIAWLDGEVTTAIDRITLDRGTFQAGEAIYRMEDCFRSLFIVQSGLVKVEKILEDGTNQVTGFCFSGDLFGLKSIGHAHYGYDAIALETTKICEITYSGLEALCASYPSLQQLLITLLGNKLQQANELLFDGRQLCAEQRLLRFIKGLCERKLLWCGDDRSRLHLPMSKTDIASFLGVRPESVSRALTNLQKQGVIRNHHRCIQVDDLDIAEH